MIKAMGLIGRLDTSTGKSIRSMIRHLATTAAVAAAPLAFLRADSFELPGSVPSVLVEQGAIDETVSAPDGTSDGQRPASFSLAACSDEDCATCGSGRCQCGADAPGFLQKLCATCGASDACWIGRIDALLLWRNAPPSRPLIATDEGAPAINANQLDSQIGAGPRVSVIRRDRCSGAAIEATYFNVANFQSQRRFDDFPDSNYILADPGFYGNVVDKTFTEGTVNLGSRIQSFELNRLFGHGQTIRWIAGFRWVEWREHFLLNDSNIDVVPVITDRYATDCINSLYGGHIGTDFVLLTLPWLRVDSVVKAGAFYNNAVQRSSYTTDEFGFSETLTVRVGDSPLSCAFVGEVGITGVMQITNRIDFRFGYFGLWLSGIAQPTQQLSGQQLVPGEDIKGGITDNGGVLVQGVTLGLEGRW